MATAATAAPAFAQSAGFAPAPKVAAPATGVATGRGSTSGPSLSGRPWQGDERPRPCSKRGRCRDRNFFFGYGLGYGYGHDRDFGYRDMMAEARNGYFNNGGETRGLRNGRVSYDYDRGYPYEYYRSERNADDFDWPREYTARTRHCETELTRDRQGRQVSVRVCRN
jgi:hypothetical protein